MNVLDRERFWRQCSGTTAVETAIVLPAFLLVLFMILEAGRAFWTQSSLQFAVEAAARCASLGEAQCTSVGSIQSYAAAQAAGIAIPSSNFTVTEPSCGTQVAVSYNFSFVVTNLLPGSITLAAQSCHP